LKSALSVLVCSQAGIGEEKEGRGGRKKTQEGNDFVTPFFIYNPL
jgi:hypothetical protein